MFIWFYCLLGPLTKISIENVQNHQKLKCNFILHEHTKNAVQQKKCNKTSLTHKMLLRINFRQQNMID